MLTSTPEYETKHFFFKLEGVQAIQAFADMFANFKVFFNLK